MLELVAICSRKVKQRSVVEAPNCSCSAALEQIANFTKDRPWLYIAYIVFPSGKIGTSDPAHSLAEEVEDSRLTALINDYVFWQFLKRLAKRTDELKLTC